ncbi:MAG: alanine racemase [Alphaproteobacteria bacterium]
MSAPSSPTIGRPRRALDPVPCAAVVKADAYGLGLAEVAPALAAAGCTTFFVAHLGEGVALRAHLPSPEIFAVPSAGPARVRSGHLRGPATWRRPSIPRPDRPLGAVLPRAWQPRRHPPHRHGHVAPGPAGGRSRAARRRSRPARRDRLRYVMTHLACPE